ncbi:uncharacterized protein HRG_01993 [Hirsutella rhossiliensis]|uniref:Uncharacterized protein n=1 Tax=Hirsutella rhossiliensis TaxID=111463 RepID=A0A9P8N6B1_9HYPO|nr:uncharacterized protein HRG_01993 [Hirsutella rhossiliensis]KAH0966584.1 hypothetical protein HRG_01993 [Hirsutella rhossiliensis]
MKHHLLIYSVKYWAKHIDDFHKTADSKEMCKEVDSFIRSRNFGTCVQLQSLFVQWRFSIWYIDWENGIYYTSEVEDRNKKKHFSRGLPSCYTDHDYGKPPFQEYNEAIAEWGYFLNSSYGPCAQDVQVLLLHERHEQEGMQVEAQRWTVKKLGHRHKLQTKKQILKITDEQLRLYTRPLQDREAGRATQAAITGCGGLLRIGHKVYAQDDAGLYRVLEMGDSRIARDDRPCDEADSSSSSSDSDDDEALDEANPIQSLGEVQGCSAMETQLDAQEDSEWSNSARASHSDGSTTDISDEMHDDEFWDDWGSEDEDMEFKDIDAATDESSASASSMISEWDGGPGDIPMHTDIHDLEFDLDGDNSDIPSAISTGAWADSDSNSQESEDGPGPLQEAETTVNRASDKRELVILFHDRSNNLARRVFRFAYRWAGQLFNSPPVIHPTHELAVWPLGRNEILFANFTKHTYFIRSLKCGAKDMCHISIQAKFSDCGRFLHLACLDGCLGSSSNSHPSHVHTKKASPALRGLYIRVSTYRLSQGKPSRSPPRLVHRASAPLDCHLLRQDDGQQLPASPLPYTFTWTADHLYAAESYRVLRVYRVPLHQVPGSDDVDGSKPAQVVFSNEAEIFLPKSADSRSVLFFPAPDGEADTKTTEKKAKRRTKSSTSTTKKKSDGDQVVATVIISSEVSLLAGVQPYVGPPQVVYLTAAEFGSWRRLCGDPRGSGEGDACAKTWKGGQLEARYEKFDHMQDCDIVPFFR